jgi:hypothetical protein
MNSDEIMYCNMKLIKIKKNLLETINSAIVMEQRRIEGLRQIFIWVEQDLLSIEDATIALKEMYH